MDEQLNLDEQLLMNEQSNDIPSLNMRTMTRTRPRKKRKCPRKRRSKRKCSKIRFQEDIFMLTNVSDTFVNLRAQNTSQLTTYSYAIVNLKSVPVLAKVEISPDNRNFTEDREVQVPAESTRVLVPTKFLRFTRIALRSEDPEQFANVKVFFQAQTIKC